MIRSHHRDGLSLLTIDRPDKANALTADMLRDLRAGVAQALDSGARALILTGAGRVFSAGADLDRPAPAWPRPPNGRICPPRWPPCPA